jgi:hypothetical protein
MNTVKCQAERFDKHCRAMRCLTTFEGHAEQVVEGGLRKSFEEVEINAVGLRRRERR